MRAAAIWIVAAIWSCAPGSASVNDLQGVWTFEKEVNTRADGTIVKVPEPEYDGLLIYTSDGYVSANVMPRSRGWKIESATLRDLLGSVGEGASTAYAGRYAIDPITQTVTHTPVTNVDPSDVGKPLVRHYVVAGDKLLLSGKWRYQGQELTFTVHWRRAK